VTFPTTPRDVTSQPAPEDADYPRIDTKLLARFDVAESSKLGAEPNET